MPGRDRAGWRPWRLRLAGQLLLVAAAMGESHARRAQAGRGLRRRCRRGRRRAGPLVIDTGEDAVRLRLTPATVRVVDESKDDDGRALRAAIAPGELARLVF